MPDGVNIPGGPVFSGSPQPPDVPCDPVGDAWRGPQGPAGPMGPAGPDSNSVINVLDHGAVGNGTTDDTAAIQGALNTYAGKATVFIPWTSASFRTGKLTLPSSTSLLIHGRLFALPGLPSGYIDIVNVGNVTIDGYGSIDANGPAQTAVGGMAGMAISGSTNVRVSGITITNAFHWNINVTQSSNVVFYGATLTKGGAANEFAAGSDDCWLTNCTIDGTGLGDYGFCFYGGVTNSGALGNVVRNCGVGTSYAPPGIGILSDGNPGDPPSGPCSNITISNNIIYNCGGNGIGSLNVVTGPTQFQRGIIIANNRCYNNNRVAGASVNADIFIAQSDAVTISGNQIGANGGASIASVTGIYLDSTASHINVTGNQIYNVAKGRNDGSGIWTNANYVHASGNYIYDSQTTPTMQYSVIGGGGTHNAWIGNYSDIPTNVGINADTINANALTGVFTVGGPGGTADHIMAIVGAQSHRAGLQYQTQGLPRWLVGTDGATDGSGMVGSNYVIAPYNDSNALQSPALSINRATGRLILGTLPTNAANDAAAATAGVPVGGVYRNASALMVRTV